jgi:hypothetical protein
MAALRNHDSCGFCFEVHVKKGSAFCTDLENKMALALGKVQSPLPDNEVPEDAPPVLVGKR